MMTDDDKIEAACQAATRDAFNSIRQIEQMMGCQMMLTLSDYASMMPSEQVEQMAQHDEEWHDEYTIDDTEAIVNLAWQRHHRRSR